jgi:CheY-like chemotaxis protein
MHTDRKTVLFVDDDTEFIELIQSLAEQSKGQEWNVLTATTTAKALRLLDSHRIDLAVLDLRMPIVDGVQFLQLIHRKYPQMKKALLSSYPDDARRQNAIQHGAELVLSKPLGLDSFEILFETLHELLRAQVEEGFRGVLRKIGLEDILQMECLSRHTSLLEVTARGESGRIYIQSGKLVHAEFGSTLGEEALNRLLALRGGEFHHAPYSDPPAHTLEGSWEFLLMEAARNRDELLAEAQEQVVDGELEAMAASHHAHPVSTVKEIVVTSDAGEVLYQRGAADPASRAATMKLLHKVAGRLDDSLPFGPLERIEFASDDGRMIARFQEQGGVFVRGDLFE